MAELNRLLFDVLGLNIQGDLGPYTCYTNKNRDRVVFLKAPPEVPASRYQAILRNKFRRVALEWANLSQPTKDLWEEASKKARIRCTGYDLYTYAAFPNHELAVLTIFRQAEIVPPF